MPSSPTCLELCAGGGGQALGLEQAGFAHVALVENDPRCCETLWLNRPAWPIYEMDIKDFDAKPFVGVDLLAGGLPCPPFSIAGKRLGEADERNLFPIALRIVRECRPRAIMIENVKGILEASFSEYRSWLAAEFAALGYRGGWKLHNASDFGVPQLRPRAIMILVSEGLPDPDLSISGAAPLHVGDVLFDLISATGWRGAEKWRDGARAVAPTLVGGSKKHGVPDLGPTRSKQAWSELGVDGHGLADAPPSNGFAGSPRLTVRMTARIQGFPDEWQFSGGKTAAYRQIGNAFPPPVARVLGMRIADALSSKPECAGVG